MNDDGPLDGDPLDRAIGDWLAFAEDHPGRLPGEFAASLPEDLRAPFLRELEALADLDQLATAAPPRHLPRRFGDFRVLGELGRGAMGAVYAAEQVSSGRRVALKVMHAHVANDARAASRFAREARTAASLAHPGIVPVLGFGDENGSAWLAMDLVEGRSLQRLLAASLDPRDADHGRARTLLDDPWRLARTLADAALALEYAHRHNVVHRDVKPGNLMWSDDDRMVVLDFGLATARDPDTSTLTRTGDFLGTPLYMAPEQALGAENGNPGSDIYALGAVLYECLCQRPPVAPGPLANVIDAILNRDPQDPRQRRAGVPAELARIALQCLEKDPARRYPTAAALAADLCRFVDGDSVHARKSGVLQRSLRRLRRRPISTALALAVVLLVPTVYWISGYANERDVQAAILEAKADQMNLRQRLALSPEGITVFGGASRRFYCQLGLGDHLPAAESARSPNATAALQIAERLVQNAPTDAEVLRTLARVLLDLGDDAKRTEQVLQTLLALPAVLPADRAMAAVWLQQQGRFDEAERAFTALDQRAPGVAFWLGFWHQHRQDYFAAIAAFDAALRTPDLDDEQRYFALLHRGWCQTCPDVCRIRAAEDDLLQAAALRPNYGTARLLWAALRCLDSTDDLSRPVKAVEEVLTTVQMEPWVVVLTARVLLALAEASTWQAGPVQFAAEFSPIAALPLPPGRQKALAGKGLELLDAVLTKRPELFEARFHRIEALALLGRHADALAEADQLQARAQAGQFAAIHLQRARVHLAAGRTQRAREAADRALAADDRFVAAWRFQADLAAWLGDLERELDALERAARHLCDERRLTSVCPDGAVTLPDLQLRRARRLLASGRTAAAEDLLRHGDFGGVLAGESGPRVTTQRNALLAGLDGENTGRALSITASVPADSPLQLLSASPGRVPELGGAAFAAGLQRRWLSAAALPVTLFDQQSPWTAATADLLMARAEPASTGALQALARVSPPDLPTSLAALLGFAARGDEVPAAMALPLGILTPNLRDLTEAPANAARLLRLADAQQALDPENAEARLLRASVLFVVGRHADAAAFLDATLDAFPDDVRGRYLLAAAALAGNNQTLVRRALQRGRTRLDAASLEVARSALRTPVATTAAELLAALR